MILVCITAILCSGCMGQIEEQKKKNELERLKTEQALITSKGLTKEILYKQFVDKWDGKTPLYGVTPEFLKMTN